MLHVLLLILKIIGIIILAILGLLILLLLILLFVPLRYKIKGSGEGELSSLKGRVDFSWLLHLISGYVIYQDKNVIWQARIAWKKLNQDAEETATQKESEIEVKQEAVSDPEPESKVIVRAQEIQSSEETQSVEKKQVIEKVQEQEETVKVQDTEVPSAVQKKPRESENKTSFLAKLQAILEKIKYTFQKICDNIKSLLEKKEKLEDFVTDDVHQAALSRVMKELKRLLGFLKPKRFRVNAHLGFADPSLTGKVLAGLSILYPFVGKNNLNVIPEFEQEIYEGNIEIKGHIRVVYVIIIGWNLIWDKNVRITFKHIKNLKK